MAMLKYRVHEVAKDFGTTSKVITQILTDYMTPPKNHMQVLENPELDVIFEYMTQHNQVESLEDIFKVAPPVEKKPEPAAEEPKAEEQAPAAADAAGTAKPAAAAPEKKGGQAKPAPAQGQTGSVKKKEEKKPHVPRQVAEKRVVDTRGGPAVNIEKYNEKFEDMAGSRTNANKLRGGQGGGSNKEKINSKSKQRQQAQQQSSGKRRQEERDKMNRLQREIAKKKPLKVEIPDQISVGELASRMKKTAAEVIKPFSPPSRISSTMTPRPWSRWSSAARSRRKSSSPWKSAPTSSPARRAASPSTSAPIPSRSTAAPSPSSTPRATRPLPPCAPAAPW